MSRSLSAWTKSCAVGAARRGVAGFCPNQVEAHLGYERLVRTISSLTPLIWVVAASMVMLTLSPAALGKVANPRARSSSGPATGGAPKMYAALPPNSRSTDPSPGGGRLARGRNANAEALALGSGYATPHGSRAVRTLQRHLAVLGYQPGPIDGRYGPLTKAAVIRFQATHGLATDGIAGVRTRAALGAAKLVLYPGEGYGPNGSRLVRSLQRNLAVSGFSPGAIDGRYGPLTEHAVSRFQNARHLRVDGIAGTQTLDHLHRGHSGRTHHRQHQVPTRRPTGRRGTRPAPVRPGGAPRHANPGSAPARKARTIPASGLPVVWVIVLAGLLLAVLAGLLWHWRGARDRRSGTRPVEAGGGHRGEAAAPPTAARADNPDTAAVPDGYAVSAGGLSATRTEVPGDDQQDGAWAFRLGLLLAREGDRVGAEDAFRRADKQGHAGGAFELGNLLVQEADTAGAKEAFARADRRGHPGAAFDLGVLLVQEGDRAGAKEAFRRAEERGQPDAAFDLGALLLQEGDRTGAEEAFRRADQNGDGGAACNLGVLLEQRGDLAGAEEAYRRADERGHRVGACNLGALLEQRGYMAAAKAAYRRADERGDSAGAYHLGVLLERLGDRAGAKDAYRRADQRGHPEGACHLGLLLKDEGDHTGAVRALQHAGERGSPEVAKVARAAMLELAPGEEEER